MKLRRQAAFSKGTGFNRALQFHPIAYSTTETRAFAACPKPPRSVRSFYASIAFLFLLAPALPAATLSGTVTNGTTGKPSAGDEVILIKLAAGMEEVGHAKTDAKGSFTFTFDDTSGPHLVRAIHQGVTYHTPAPPGTTTI